MQAGQHGSGNVVSCNVQFEKFPQHSSDVIPTKGEQGDDTDSCRDAASDVGEPENASGNASEDDVNSGDANDEVSGSSTAGGNASKTWELHLRGTFVSELQNLATCTNAL